MPRFGAHVCETLPPSMQGFPCPSTHNNHFCINRDRTHTGCGGVARVQGRKVAGLKITGNVDMC